MSKKVDMKRIIVDGQTRLIVVDLVVNECVLVEKDVKKGIYNIYFPVDEPNKVYALGTSFPISILDGYVTARINKNLNERAKAMNNDKEIKSVLKNNNDEDEIG